MRTGEAHRVAQLCDIAETGVLGRPEEVPLMQMHVVENLVVVVDRGGRDADAIHLFDNFGDGVIAQSVSMTAMSASRFANRRAGSAYFGWFSRSARSKAEQNRVQVAGVFAPMVT